MSTLTKEEKEFIADTIRFHSPKYPTQDDVDITALIRIINRLVAENEELRKNLNKTAEAHCETQRWWNADMKKLTALIEAAEPIVGYFDDGYCSALPDNTLADVELPMLVFRNLNKAVKEAKG